MVLGLVLSKQSDLYALRYKYAEVNELWQNRLFLCTDCAVFFMNSSKDVNPFPPEEALSSSLSSSSDPHSV